METITKLEQAFSAMTTTDMITRMVDYSAGLTDTLPPPEAIPFHLVGADQDTIEAMQAETARRLMDRQQHGCIENYSGDQAVEYLKRDVTLKAGLIGAVLESDEAARDKKLVELRDRAIEQKNVEFASQVASILSIARNANIERPVMDYPVSERLFPEALQGEIAELDQALKTDIEQPQLTDQVLDLVNKGQNTSNRSLAEEALMEARELALSMQQLGLAAFCADLLASLQADEDDEC